MLISDPAFATPRGALRNPLAMFACLRNGEKRNQEHSSVDRGTLLELPLCLRHIRLCGLAVVLSGGQPGTRGSQIRLRRFICGASRVNLRLGRCHPCPELSCDDRVILSKSSSKVIRSSRTEAP